MWNAIFGPSSPRSAPGAEVRGLMEELEERALMSVSTIGIGPPPTGGGAVAVVETLSPQQTETGKPHISVTVNPPPVLTIPDKAPPPPPTVSEIVVVKVIDKASP